MALKEILDKIQGKLPTDIGEDITALLADAKREATTVLSDLSSANSESKTRKEKIRELEAEKDTLNQEISKLSTNDNKAELERLKAIETEFTAHKQELDNKTIAEWKAISEIFNIKDTDKRFPKISKIKDRFVLADELTIDQARENMKNYALLTDAGAFEVESTIDTGGRAPIGNLPGQPQTAGEAYVQQLKTK